MRRRRVPIGTTTERDRDDFRAVFRFVVRFFVLRLPAVAARFLVARLAIFLLAFFLTAAVFALPVARLFAPRLATFFLPVVAFFLVRRAVALFFLPLAAVARFFATFLVAFFLAVVAFFRVLRRAAVATFFFAGRFFAAARATAFLREVPDFLRLTLAKVTSPYELH